MKIPLHSHAAVVYRRVSGFEIRDGVRKSYFTI
jgi:hypothetical protein